MNRGKQFEEKLKADFSSIPDSFILRLPDQKTGYYGSSRNVCDFIGFMYPKMFLLEAKSIKGNTFPLTNFTQYTKLKEIPPVKGLNIGVVLWFIEHNRVVYVPLKTFDDLYRDGKKSFNIRTIDQDGYSYVEIPSKKKRVFLDSDYSVLQNID